MSCYFSYNSHVSSLTDLIPLPLSFSCLPSTPVSPLFISPQKENIWWRRSISSQGDYIILTLNNFCVLLNIPPSPHLYHIQQYPSRDCPKSGQQKWHQDLQHHGADRLRRRAGALCILCCHWSTQAWPTVELIGEQKVCLSVLLWLVTETGVDRWNIPIRVEMLWTFRVLGYGWIWSVLLTGAASHRAARGLLIILWLWDNHGVKLVLAGF